MRHSSRSPHQWSTINGSNKCRIYLCCDTYWCGGCICHCYGRVFVSKHTLDVAKYRSRWLSIEQQLKKGEVSTYQLCVLNADKLLDHALKELGTKGQTMGERMKVTKWNNANAVWSAHKVRNQIAHEADITIEYAEARRALAGFKQGLKDLGAI
jgi:hypothetical protein